MLLNIQTLGFDFIQGPMGAWNFACFGATAGVLFLSVRDRDVTMRQTATGALAAGLLGGISEPSLYGIHLRFKRIYPRILVGCFLGGLVQGIGGGLTTNAFVFTSLLTIPAFSNIPLYAISIAVAFFSSMLLVVFFDYRTADERAEAAKVRATEMCIRDSQCPEPRGACRMFHRHRRPVVRHPLGHRHRRCGVEHQLHCRQRIGGRGEGRRRGAQGRRRAHVGGQAGGHPAEPAPHLSLIHI